MVLRGCPGRVDASAPALLAPVGFQAAVLGGTWVVRSRVLGFRVSGLGFRV